MKTHKKDEQKKITMQKKGQNENVMWIILVIALFLLITYILFKILRRSGVT